MLIFSCLQSMVPNPPVPQISVPLMPWIWNFYAHSPRPESSLIPLACPAGHLSPTPPHHQSVAPTLKRSMFLAAPLCSVGCSLHGNTQPLLRGQCRREHNSCFGIHNKRRPFPLFSASQQWSCLLVNRTNRLSHFHIKSVCHLLWSEMSLVKKIDIREIFVFGVCCSWHIEIILGEVNMISNGEWPVGDNPPKK